MFNMCHLMYTSPRVLCRIDVGISVPGVAAARQLEVLKYEPMMVEALLEEYEVPFNVIEVPLEDLPLHMNDEGIITEVLCKWRFQRGK